MGTSVILFVTSFIIAPIQLAAATVSDECGSSIAGSNEVVPCIGVNGSGDWVNYVDVGAQKFISSVEYQFGYVQVGWFAPGAALSQTNFHVWETTKSINFYWFADCQNWYWWQQQGASWKTPCSTSHTYGWWVNNYVGSKDQICTRTWVKLSNGSYYGSKFICVTITP